MTDNYPSEPYPVGGSGSTGIPSTPVPPVVGAPPVTGTSHDTGSDSSSSTGGSMTDTAKEQAKNVGGSAADAAKNVGGTAADSAKGVASTAKEEAGHVASTAKRQAKDLVHETRAQLTEQAGAQQEKVASGLHALSDELRGMADSSTEPGIAADLVSQAASRASGVATWLEDRDPGSLLEEVKNYARRKPGTFIAVAAVAGVLAGRLTRSLVSEAKDSAADGATSSSSTPDASTATPGYDATATTAHATPTSYTPPTSTDSVGGVAGAPVYGTPGTGAGNPAGGAY
ncbi:hypothetical protein ELQ90_05835 [Labedella phragmitis]|uniref:DUF3618 domain-containing protein n=1 Tax=Labedella phragmitis TaxID=2498849 RepID=A0A3S3Z4Q6_9MICO|nr:hypothetical protein [Labedella phragmitis]RWZ51623.1 hypothetical protein ELQ90_05835 [Labedella phragmitis]